MTKVSSPTSPGKVKEILLDFSSETSLHGLRHIFHDSSKHRRTMWFFVFVGAAIVNFWLLQKCFVRFFAYPTTTEMNEEFPGASGLPFPAISFCPTGVLMKSKINMPDTDPTFYQLGLNISACQQTAHLRKNMTCGNFLKCGILTKYTESCMTLFPKLKKFFGSLNASVKTAFDKEFRDHYGPDLKSMLIKCLYNGQNVCFAKNFTTFLTFHGKCFTFNYEGSLRSTSTRYMSGFYLVLDSKMVDSLWNGMIDGVKVCVHQPKRNVRYGNCGTIAPVTYLPDPYKAKCRKKPLPGNRPYSSEACMDECSGNQFIERCGCHTTDYRGLTTAPACLYSDFDCLKSQVFKSRKTCVCPPACETIKYRSRVSTYGFSIHGDQRGFLHLSNASINWNNLVIIFVGYESLTYNVVQQKSAYDVQDFFGELGGNMGFFLGCSILTLIELLEMKFRVLTTFLCSKLGKVKHKNENSSK